MADVPIPNEPMKDRVLSRGRRLNRAIFFVVIGYFLYYIIVDRLLLRPILGADITFINWVFGIAWTLIGFITIFSIYWPDRARKQDMLEPVQTQVVQPTVTLSTPVAAPPVTVSAVTVVKKSPAVKKPAKKAAPKKSVPKKVASKSVSKKADPKKAAKSSKKR